MIWPMVNIKNLTKRRESDKFFREKAFTIASNPKYDVCQRGLASMVHRNFDKKSTDSDIKSKIMTNQQLPEELQNQLLENLSEEEFILPLKTIFGELI